MPEVFAGSASYPSPSPRPVLSIGNFDGVHRGHRHLLAALTAQARALGAPTCVYTFQPPPRVVLAPGHHQPRILAWPDKVRLLGEAGVDHVIVERFTRAFAQHPPEWFATEVLGRRIQPRAMVVGYDFRFGRARRGDLDLLRQHLPGVALHQVDAWQAEDATVSSSRIRRLVLDGQVDAASRLMGRPFLLRGTVVPGDQRGRAIGFPTANLETDGELLPAPGVYAVRASLPQGPWFDAVANLGTRPTFQGVEPRVEVHLLDFSGDLYGRELLVRFIERLRPERRFEDPDALARQIRLDTAAARERLGTGAPR